MDQPAARDLASQILSRELGGIDAPTAVIAAGAGERAFKRLSDNLMRWVGPDGSQALLTRALSLAQARDPALRVVPPPARSALFLGALATSVQPHEGRVVGQGVVVILTHFIELLTRLIGEDLAIRLVAEVPPGQFADAVRPPDAGRPS